MSKKTRNIIIISAGIILAFVAYNFFFVGEEETSLEPSGIASSNLEVGRELLAILAQLQSLSFEGDVLQRPDFRSLRDFSVTIVPQPLGRRNPFAPIGIGSIPSESDSSGVETDDDSPTSEGEESEPIEEGQETPQQ